LVILKPSIARGHESSVWAGVEEAGTPGIPADNKLGRALRVRAPSNGIHVSGLHESFERSTDSVLLVLGFDGLRCADQLDHNFVEPSAAHSSYEEAEYPIVSSSLA
jgi:hypothetical protein